MVEWVELSKVFNLRNGYTPSTKNPDYWDEGTIPWFRMEDIRENGNILKDSISHITPKGVKKTGLFPANSIIVATSATIGEHALIEVEALSNQRFTNLYPKEKWVNLLNMKFVHYYMFIVDEWCKTHTNNGGFASVDMKGFSKLEFPIPSLSEQNRIVGILDTFTASIDNLKQQIEQRKKQYEHYRDQLLDLEGKPGVEMKRIDEVCMPNRGVRVIKKELAQAGDIPVYQNSISPMGYYQKSNYDANTPFVITAGAAGEVGFSDIPFWAADDCLCLKCTNLVLPRFVFHYLSKQQFFLKTKVRKGAIPRLSRKVIESLSIPVIDLISQEGIVSKLSFFEDSISNLEQQLEQRQKQYEYYRNKLLTFE